MGEKDEAAPSVAWKCPVEIDPHPKGLPPKAVKTWQEKVNAEYPDFKDIVKAELGGPPRDMPAAPIGANDPRTIAYAARETTVLGLKYAWLGLPVGVLITIVGMASCQQPGAHASPSTVIAPESGARTRPPAVKTNPTQSPRDLTTALPTLSPTSMAFVP